jgi:hypothetical protein
MFLVICLKNEKGTNIIAGAAGSELKTFQSLLHLCVAVGFIFRFSEVVRLLYCVE